jgi:hypothetical protein
LTATSVAAMLPASTSRPTTDLLLLAVNTVV